MSESMTSTHYYRRKPLMVQAFRFGHDADPPWFQEIVALGRVSVVDVETRRIAIATPTTVFRADLGDYIINVEALGIWVCEQRAFNYLYESDATATRDMLWSDKRIAEGLGEIIAHQMANKQPPRYDDELLYQMRDEYEQLAGKLRQARASDFLMLMEVSKEAQRRMINLERQLVALAQAFGLLPVSEIAILDRNYWIMRVEELTQLFDTVFAQAQELTQDNEILKRQIMQLTAEKADIMRYVLPVIEAKGLAEEDAAWKHLQEDPKND